MSCSVRNHIEKRTFTMDRKNSGDTSFSKDFPAETVAPTIIGETMKLRIFVDKSSVEVFDGNGRFTMSNLIFPSVPYNMIRCSSTKKCRIHSLTIYNLK